MSKRIEKYVNSIVRFLKLHPMIKDVAVERRTVTRNRGYIKATVTFVNDSQLRIREFINGRLSQNLQLDRNESERGQKTPSQPEKGEATF